MTYKEIAHKLWDLLDEISTLGDIFKPEINAYFKAVSNACEQRGRYLTSDGYELFPVGTVVETKKFTGRDSFAGMTKEHAMVIRALRISGCTWGRISEIMTKVTETNEPWGQMDGQEMCQKAADILVDDSDFELETKRLYRRLKIEVEKLENS